MVNQLTEGEAASEHEAPVLTPAQRARYEARLRRFRRDPFGLVRFCTTAKGVNLDPERTRWMLDHDPRVERINPTRGGWPTWRKKLSSRLEAGP